MSTTLDPANPKRVRRVTPACGGGWVKSSSAAIDASNHKFRPSPSSPNHIKRGPVNGYVDLGSIPDTAREAQALQVANEEAHLPFDLANDPPFRGCLLRLSDDEHILLLTLHYIVSDRWSMEILSREVAELYEAFSNGRLSSLNSLPVQYGDFARWEKQWLRSDVAQAQLAYWKQRLGGHLEALKLPLDRPRTGARTFQYSSERQSLSCTLSERLKGAGCQQGVTPFMVMLTAFKILLYVYTQAEDVRVATVCANRTHVEIEPLIGYFVNTLILRTDLSGNPTFKALLQRVRHVVLDAYAQQDLPFERLWLELEAEAGPVHAPLCQVQFNFQNVFYRTLRLQGLTLTRVPLPTDSNQPTFSTLDLTIDVEEGSEGLTVTAQYDIVS